MKKINLSPFKGFTFIEMIVVLIMAGIVAAIVINAASRTSDSDIVSQVNIVKNHIRYAQSIAMKRGVVAGITCNGARYWFFQNNNPDLPANQSALPGEGSVKVTLADKNVTMSAFTVFFTVIGRPCSAYTDETTNTPFTAPLTVTMNSVPSGSTATFTITPETGFIE